MNFLWVRTLRVAKKQTAEGETKMRVPKCVSSVRLATAWVAIEHNVNDHTQPASDIIERVGNKTRLGRATASAVCGLCAGTMCDRLAWCTAHLWEISELWYSLGELNKVLDLEHATVLLVRHLAEET